ncbi:hypothetical protein NEF87_002741 [Candidatus Lokiarchaeum ossiferum]|uniref:Rad51-like C-terminal domain-containing protein n=1 Tax=Candidatus Lokiarchaeum ossiferum TaxID=2951803 RepID=A0ABY6HV37_9ARCH|nr:hypothetical protein NEF87_002741 [Candidatus Lokiarchaeum sp. B-35]
MISASEYLSQINKQHSLSSGDIFLNKLLGGGFLPGLVHFLHGAKQHLSVILMKTAVNSFKSSVDGGLASNRVLYVDGENRFNPYWISKMAISNGLNPEFVLQQILVARAFTWNQMVELMEEKLILQTDEKIDLILVAGLTSMFEENLSQNVSSSQINLLNIKTYNDLNRIFLGLKRITQHSNPIIVLTGPRHSKSNYRPAGGKLLSHFSNIIIGVREFPRFIEYSLDQHPFYSYNVQRSWKPAEIKKGRLNSSRGGVKSQTTTLDSFFTKKLMR